MAVNRPDCRPDFAAECRLLRVAKHHTGGYGGNRFELPTYFLILVWLQGCVWVGHVWLTSILIWYLDLIFFYDPNKNEMKNSDGHGIVGS